MTGKKSGSAALHYISCHATHRGRYCNYCVYLWSLCTQIEALEGRWVPYSVLTSCHTFQVFIISFSGAHGV